MVFRPVTYVPPLRPLTTGHFRMKDRYAVLRENGTRDWLLILTVAGAGRFAHAGGEVAARPGDLVLLRPGTRHEYGLEERLRRWELYWAHFLPRPAWIPWLAWPEEAPGLFRIAAPENALRRRIKARFGEAHGLATGSLRRREEFALNAFEELLLWCDAANPGSGQRRLDPRVGQALEFARANLGRPLSIAQWARACHLSPSRFAHLFRDQTGLTPRAYLEQERIREARRLLEFTPKNVSEIAALVGFQNPFYFSRRFRQHAGASPRAYRRRPG